MVIIRVISLLALLFTVHVQAAEALQGVRLNHYPSRVQVQELMRRAVNRVVIESRFDPVTGSVLGYPSTVHVQNLNLFEGVSVDLHIDISSYPTAAVQARLSDLESHVSLEVKIRNCLSQASEAQRLRGVERTAHFIVYCNTDRSVDDARELADQVMADSPQLRVEVVREF